ncbi:MAG: long-chain fatty acid--CoA ligase [Verrucomicrobiota bacterium]
MTSELSIFAARVREHIGFWADDFSLGGELRNDPAYLQHADIEFSSLAVMLFTLQFKHNAPYRRLCEARGIQPSNVTHWTQIPAVPTAAFKEFELSGLHPEERTHVFHSSGTTEQRPSRHFHSVDSLAVYEASLWPWFVENLRLPIVDGRMLSLTPPAQQVPRSSLVYMFDFVRQKIGAEQNDFLGRVGADGSWSLDVEAAISVLSKPEGKPHLVLGTAFSFVYLLDALAEKNLLLKLPAGSRVLETGGYKGRSRTMPKDKLHRLIAERLGMPVENIICEYGMSELSSQAYDSPWATGQRSMPGRVFQFPPWARARVISPENGREVAEGETGLLQVFDLANVFSVMAIQTEDLAIRRGVGFELIGRAQQSEARGCSLMSS